MTCRKVAVSGAGFHKLDSKVAEKVNERVRMSSVAVSGKVTVGYLMVCFR